MRIKDQDVCARYIKALPVQQLFSVSVEGMLEVHRFKKGEYICDERKAPEKLYFLAEGKVKLYMIHQDGNVSLAQYYEPGDVLGELEFLEIRNHSQSIQAVEDSVCIAISTREHKELLLSDAIFLRNLSRLIAEKMLRSVSKLVATQTYPLENRLAAYFLEKEAEKGEGQWVEISLTDLSQYLGISYRHLSRVVKQFAQAGWIDKQRGKVRILDREALEDKVAQMETE